MFKKRCIVSIIVVLFSFFSLMTLPHKLVLGEGTTVKRFSDIPEGHWADKFVHSLRSLSITDGIGDNNFGLGKTINKGEFVAFLVKLMKWEMVTPEKGSFDDNLDKSKWYYASIETALANKVIVKQKDVFEPNKPITREEMAIMLVRTLGYDQLAQQLSKITPPFVDVNKNVGYISIAKDFGMISGSGGNKFNPDNTATREQAAVIMIQMYDRLQQSFNELHGFYAISSYSQRNMLYDLNSVSFGWARLEYDSENMNVVLNTTNKNQNEYAFPQDYSQPLELANNNNLTRLLMVTVKEENINNIDDDSSIKLQNQENSMLLSELIVTEAKIRKQVIESIISRISKEKIGDNSSIDAFDGITIDFELLKGDKSRSGLNDFLLELKQELEPLNKKLYIAVHPRMKPGSVYYDGYDFKTIGAVADKVILMAHDYNSKKLTEAEMESGYTITPLTPLEDIYYALKYITDKQNGVQDINKIMLQISFDSAQWKIKDGKVINQYPYLPEYTTIKNKLYTDVDMNYSNINQNPYITFHNSSDETDNVLWYEDSRSVQAKLNLAKMFGLRGVSIWRLGNIPDYDENVDKAIYLDVWKQIKGNFQGYIAQ